jgi:hypothetical protein
VRSSLSSIARRSVTAAAGAAVLAVGMAGAAGAATAVPTAVKSYTVSASTSITGRPDSGLNGYWATDGTQAAPLRRAASLTLQSEVALSLCGGHTGTGHCYHWTGKVSDAGGFVTTVDGTSPGAGDLNTGPAPAIGAAATGTMKGSITYDFFSSWKTASAATVGTTENDGGNLPGGSSTTSLWPEKFFGKGATFYQANTQVTLTSGTLEAPGGAWAWTYTLGFGADKACPNLASQWVDSSAGSGASFGNILAPAAGSC